MCDNKKLLNTCHSYHTSKPPMPAQSDGFSKSDFTLPTSSATSRSSNHAKQHVTNFPQYYKKYEYDEVPVKDSDNSTKYERPSFKGSITNSEIDNLERRIYKNVSQELQTEDSSLSSLESNIKFFKTTVEKIFENFYTSMSDFEHYKKRFHEILGKSKEGSIDDMEDFIKDMFEHIMSSDHLASNISRHTTENGVSEIDDKEMCVSSGEDTENEIKFVEAYKNEHYVTDSDENSTKIKRLSKIEEIFNIVLLNGSPYLEIKLDGRNLLSEINIKRPTETATSGSIASADNLKKLAEKKLQLEKYNEQQDENNLPDRVIPVKVSNAKKNIYLNEDFGRNNENNEKSFLAKICNILCKKFRKTTLG